MLQMLQVEMGDLFRIKQESNLIFILGRHCDHFPFTLLLLAHDGNELAYDFLVLFVARIVSEAYGAKIRSSIL